MTTPLYSFIQASTSCTSPAAAPTRLHTLRWRAKPVECPTRKCRNITVMWSRCQSKRQRPGSHTLGTFTGSMGGSSMRCKVWRRRALSQGTWSRGFDTRMKCSRGRMLRWFSNAVWTDIHSHFDLCGATMPKIGWNIMSGACSTVPSRSPIPSSIPAPIRSSSTIWMQYWIRRWKCDKKYGLAVASPKCRWHWIMMKMGPHWPRKWYRPPLAIERRVMNAW